MAPVQRLPGEEVAIHYGAFLETVISLVVIRRRRRLPHRPLVHKGAVAGRGQAVSVLPGSECAQSDPL